MADEAMPDGAAAPRWPRAAARRLYKDCTWAARDLAPPPNCASGLAATRRHRARAGGRRGRGARGDEAALEIDSAAHQRHMEEPTAHDSGRTRRRRSEERARSLTTR